MFLGYKMLELPNYDTWHDYECGMPFYQHSTTAHKMLQI